MLCMGVFAFFAARIGGWFGLERGVLWSVVLIGLATVGRFAGDDVAVLYTTTVVVGAGIVVGQALLPAVVKRYFADRAALVTGLYTVGFNAGAAIAAGATVSLETAFGGSWPAALAFWALLGAVRGRCCLVADLGRRLGRGLRKPAAGRCRRFLAVE